MSEAVGPRSREGNEQQSHRMPNKTQVARSPPVYALGRMHMGSEINLDSLARSVAPSVRGHIEAKKGLLLMLLGAVAKKSCTGDWASRGSIHVCLLGDPATAKSTFLRWVASFLPQAVYVSGASASIPGLTVAIVDEDGKAIKPGALALASGSVCCIDDFQQLCQASQNALCEVMDHQAIAVAKAGIHTRIAANTSVLVACLPNRTCYDARKPIRSNVDMPEGVWQNFDLVHVLQDARHGNDEDTAVHIVTLASSARCSLAPEISSPDLQRYISFARSLDPELSSEAGDMLRTCYNSLRERGKTTPRQLESLIRLSEAVARGHLDHIVSAAHVEEAFQLMGAVPRCEENEFDGHAREPKRARHRGA